MKEKNKFIYNLVIVIFLIVYACFNTDMVDDIKKGTAQVASVLYKETTVIKENSNDKLYVYFLDVGQADSILINFKDEYSLIDAGNNEDGPLLVNYFKELGINKFKYVIATHGHEDHIGGMDDIINNFDIDNFYMPNKLSATKTFEDMLDALESHDMKYINPKVDDLFSMYDVSFKVVYDGLLTSDINDSSLIVKLTYNNNSFLFTGDATSKVEKLIIDKDIKSDVLKVAHHGSNYSTTDIFLSRVSPKYAVISVGNNNIYKHPSLSTIEKLEKNNIKIYRTDDSNTIIFDSDGTNINVSSINTNTNGD